MMIATTFVLTTGPLLLARGGAVISASAYCPSVIIDTVPASSNTVISALNTAACGGGGGGTPQPATSWSFYVNTTDSSKLQTLGCNQGKHDQQTGIGSAVILDFGAQDSANDGTILLFDNSTTASYATDESLAEQFAYGYIACSGGTTLTLGIGTNNSGSRVDATTGDTWAQVVLAVNSWVVNNQFNSWENVEGASDMETDPGYASQTNTINWINGYVNHPGSLLYFDYGDAGGCSSSADNNSGCLDGWNQDGVWYKSWGSGHAIPAPQIYSQNDADQWLQIARYSWYVKNQKMLFDGPLDEYPEDNSTLNASQAWTALSNDLNSDAGTKQTMTHSMEIHKAA